MTELQVKTKKGSLKKFFAMFLAVCVCMTTINVNAAGTVVDSKDGAITITAPTSVTVEEGATTTLQVSAKQDVTNIVANVTGGNGTIIVSNGEAIVSGDGAIVTSEEAGEEKTLSVSCKSNNTAIATVSGTTVTGVKAGTTTITVTAGGESKPVNVIVTSKKDTTVHANKVTVAPATLPLQLGKTTTGKLTATIAPANAVEKTVTWTSDNDKIAKVDANGNVTAVAAGTTKIKATTANKVSGECTVTVKAADTVTPPVETKVPATKLTLNAKTVYIPAKASITVKATVKPANTTDKVTWSTSAKKVATVSNGKITAKNAAGKSATITAKAGSKSAKVTVYVVKKAKAMALADAKVTVGKKATLKFTGLDKATSSVKWSTSNKKVATVSNGVVTGKKAGVATIKATVGKKSVSCVVAVSKKGTSLTLKKTSATVKVNKTVKIAKKKIGSKDSIKSYKSSNKKVATVTNKGVVKGKKKGTAVITVQTKKGAYATFRVTVKK